jgi:transposase
MKFTHCGLDIAKQVFQVHGVNERGVVKGRKTLARARVLEYFAQVPPCLIGMEACGGAHYWARELSKLGHTVKLRAPQFVIPYRKRGKNDANDAEAICEAVGRPNMRFVAVKTEEQRAVLMVHRARSLVVTNRTALNNQIRGVLGESGLVVPTGVARLPAQLPQILADAANGLPVLAREAWPGHRPAGRAAEVIINHLDVAKSTGPRDADKLILPTLALEVGVDLRLRGLPNVDHRLALEYRRGHQRSS